MTPQPPQTLREELTRLSAGDPLLKEMLCHNMPLTSETYLALAWPDNTLEEWTAEREIELPEPFERPGPDYVD